MLRLVLLICGSLVAVTVTAHHAASGIYDRNNVGEIEGEVVSIFWRNPHIRLDIIRISDDGDEETWEVSFGDAIRRSCRLSVVAIATVRRVSVYKERVNQSNLLETLD